MKKVVLSLVACICLTFGFNQSAKAHAGAGLLLSAPETLGVAGTFFPTPALSIDGWATLTTVDAGLTGHIPFAHSVHTDHSMLISGMGGYVHNWINSDHMDTGDYHVVIAGGYGFLSDAGWDLRAQAGVTLTPLENDDVHCGFHASVMLGHLF